MIFLFHPEVSLHSWLLKPTVRRATAVPQQPQSSLFLQFCQSCLELHIYAARIIIIFAPNNTSDLYVRRLHRKFAPYLPTQDCKIIGRLTPFYLLVVYLHILNPDSFVFFLSFGSNPFPLSRDTMGSCKIALITVSLKVDSIQEAYAKCFAIHMLKFEILQIS